LLSAFRSASAARRCSVAVARGAAGLRDLARPLRLAVRQRDTADVARLDARLARRGDRLVPELEALLAHVVRGDRPVVALLAALAPVPGGERRDPLPRDPLVLARRRDTLTPDRRLVT
jgi:hypothetical protein